MKSIFGLFIPFLLSLHPFRGSAQTPVENIDTLIGVKQDSLPHVSDSLAHLTDSLLHVMDSLPQMNDSITSATLSNDYDTVYAPGGRMTSKELRDAAESIRIVRGVPGMTYAVFSGDSILEFQVLGFREFKQPARIELKDQFNIGTNTAAFTGYIAAKLVEAKKIKWNTELLSLFPQLRKTALPVYQKITLQELLSSRSRIQPFMDISEWFKIPNYTGTMSAKRRSFTSWMLQRKPNMKNFLTDKIDFSLAGYVIAASMLERVSGKSWENLLTEYVREPMKITINYSWPNITDPTAPFGHWVQGGDFHSEEPETWVKGNPVLFPGQGITISTPDYIKYMQTNLRGLVGKKSTLSTPSLDFLYFGIPDYSIGWNNGSYNDQSFAFHEGVSILFDCRTEILKEKNRGIIVMCNSGDKDGRGAVLELTHLLEGIYF